MAADYSTSSHLLQAGGGTPYRIVCFVLAALFFVFGIRDLFFCGMALIPNDELETLILSPYSECQTNKFQEAVSAFVGIGALLIAALRYQVATTTPAQSYYHYYSTMRLLVAVDLTQLFVAWRVGLQNVPFFYLGVVALAITSEMYILSVAHRLYHQHGRQGQKDD